MQIVLKELKYHRGKDNLGNPDVRKLISGDVGILLADNLRAVLANQNIECEIEIRDDKGA